MTREDTGQSCTVSPAVAGALEACAGFQTLERHARTLHDAMREPRPTLEELSRTLAALADRGMLWRAEEARALLAAPQNDAGAGRIGTVAIPTRARPCSLRRALDSYLEHLRTFGRSVDVLVADDADTPDEARATREIVEEANRRWRADVRYAGAEEKRTYAAALARLGAPRDELAFALENPDRATFSGGANRNFVLLRTAGSLFFGPDDDTFCAASELQEHAGGLSLEPTFSTSFYTDYDAALRSAAPLTRDLLAAHEALVGRTVPGCVGANAAEVDGSDCDPNLLDAVLGGRRVLVAQSGIVGDFAMAYPAFYLQATGEARARLLGSEEHYRAAYATRQVRHAVVRAAVSCRPMANACAASYDNRALLPPFFPVFRGEDVIFGVLLRVIHRGLVGHVPLALAHDPPKRRTFHPSERTSSAVRLPFRDLVIACAADWSCTETTPEARTESLGARMADLGGRRAEAFADFIVATCERRLAATRDRLRGLLDTYPSPPYWVRDVRETLARVEAAAGAPSGAAPDELEHLGAGAARAKAQELLLRMGRLLQAWPDIVGAARRLGAGNAHHGEADAVS